MSLRLVQYYFGTKEELLLAAMQHLAARFGERVLARARLKQAGVSGGPASPGDSIAAILTRGAARRRQAAHLHHPLGRRRHARLDPDLEAVSVLAMSAGLGTSVLTGQSSAWQAQTVIGYHLNRLFPASRPRCA